MKPFILRPLLLAAGLSLAVSAHAAGTTKDVVLDRVLIPVAAPAAAAPATTDAMVVSVLLESPDGSLSPKGTDTLFRTGDRFRIKLLASRSAKVSIYNTTPRGETKPEPIWQGNVTLGQETISPRLALTGDSGVDQVHVVMEPAQESGVFAWLGEWLRASRAAGTSKDVRLDVQNTASATYLVSARGQGLVSTVQIAHAAR